MTQHDLICIGCPMGCMLTVTEKDGLYTVTGNQCKIGENYGREEITNPTRNITTSVTVCHGDCAMLSVKTSKPIPKAAIMDCVAAVKKITAIAPVFTGDVILDNVAGTGADMVATRTVQRID